MPAYSGKFQYLDASGAILQQGPCQFQFDADTAILTPQNASPIAFDLGDVDRLTPAEWDLELALYTGRKIQLRQFGAAFGTLSPELVAAWRDRTIRCLLLEDLEEAGRFTGWYALHGEPAASAEIRLYRSNLAVLPMSGTPFQWRLAEVESAVFDNSSYSMNLQLAGEKLSISRLAKRTDEFAGKLQGALDNLRTQAASKLHEVFPFLDPDALQQLVTTMREGRSVPLTALTAIDGRLPDAIVAKGVGDRLRPYFDVLKSRATGPLMAGFKFIWEKDAAEAEGEDEEASSGGDSDDKDKMPLFFWFFFPLPNGLAAWEASTGSGHATYFFRVEGPVEEAVSHLTRGLALVNFRREPIYLSDDSLDQQAKFHRYAIARRKLPDLRTLRGAYVKRALHTSLDAWREQLP